MMQSGKIMGFFVVMPLMACHPATTETSVIAVAEVAPQPEKPSPCPSQDFSKFLMAFMEDVGLQKAFTRDPYMATVYDPQDLEGDPGVQQINANQMHFPVILSARDMTAQGVTARSEKKTSGWYEVSTQSQGTGAYTMTFNFRYLQGCWVLTDSVDAST